MKNITVFTDNKLTSVLNVTKDNKIGDIKSIYKNYEIRMFLNPTTEVPVFQDNSYDNFTLETVWDQMNNSVILLTKKEKEEKQRVWSQIPDVDKIILTKLSYKDLLSACQTSSYLSKICDNDLWRKKIAIDFPLRGKYLYFPDYIKLYKENPRKLYDIINQKSKMIVLNEQEFPELAKAVDGDEDSPEVIALINDYVLPRVNELPLLRGDVIRLDWFENYRNNGNFLWDGEKIVNLLYDYNIDEYGSISKEFAFPEFPLDHFFNTIDHNNIIWLSSNVIREIKRNFIPVKVDEDLKLFGTSIISDKYESYRVEFVNEEEVDPDEFMKQIDSIEFVDIYDANIFIGEDGMKTFSTVRFSRYNPNNDNQLEGL